MKKSMVLALCLVISLCVSGAVLAISPAEHDDFEDGTTMAWQEGPVSPNPPINVPDGGPGGVGDSFLQNDSHGNNGPGSRMVMFNQAQWTGNYNAVGSQLTISADMVNFGADPLFMRIAVSGVGARYAGATPVTLPADGVWRPVDFTLSDAEMVLVGGVGSLSEALDDVIELRILSASSPAWEGDPVAGSLGVDNFRLTTVPVELQGFTVE